MRHILAVAAMTFSLAAVAALTFFLAAPAPVKADQQPVSMRVKAPELVEVTDWVNSKPFKLADQKGKVVVLHFWTFG